MAVEVPFERSVFVNAPFDIEFEPVLQAICFCVTDLGFVPRLAPETGDNSVPRIDRILGIIRSSKYGIHDLSRCRALDAGEYARFNMPFELGLDHAAARFGPGYLAKKSILVLESERFDSQKALSDIAGWDVQHHRFDYTEAMRQVRTWLVRETRIGEPSGPSAIEGHYLAFQEWYWERERARGASEDDIRRYPTVAVVDAMGEWVELGRPVSF